MAAPPPFPAQDKVTMKPMEEAITNSTSPQEEKVKLKALKCPCPRCNSTNTKFCYYNNYSLAQPRYLCKACKRYWTQGGSLRSIPVGGRSRKNKRPSSSKLALNTKLPDLLESSSNNVTIHTNPNHLNLGFTPNLLQLPTLEAHFLNQHINYMPMQASYPNSVYPVGFSLEGFGGGGDGGRRVSFPFEDLRSITTSATAITATADSINPANTNDHRRQEHTRDHDQFGDSTGYWTGNIF